jgi:hypothetical protein
MAFPLLQRYEVPATVFLVTSWIGRDDMLDADRIARMEASGVTFGSHTVTHALLGEVDAPTMQSELADFWQSRDLALPVTHDGQAEAALLLRRRVVPRRDTILQVLDQLGALQDTGNRRRRAEAYDLNRDVRTRLLSMGGATLSVAFLVAVMASLYVAGLQRQIEQQHKSDQTNREDLERLSARLVDAQEAERRHLALELLHCCISF